MTAVHLLKRFVRHLEPELARRSVGGASCCSGNADRGAGHEPVPAAGRCRQVPVGRVPPAVLGTVMAAGFLALVLALLRLGNLWAKPLGIAVLFVAVVQRAGCSGRGRAARTLPLMMALALTLFGTGSLIVVLNPDFDFPSVADVFFGAAYLCFTGFLVLDASGRASPTAASRCRSPRPPQWPGWAWPCCRGT